MFRSAKVDWNKMSANTFFATLQKVTPHQPKERISRTKGRASKRTAFVREIVKEVAGYATFSSSLYVPSLGCGQNSVSAAATPGKRNVHDRQTNINQRDCTSYNMITPEFGLPYTTSSSSSRVLMSPHHPVLHPHQPRLTHSFSSLAPYERRVIELLRNSKDKRARKLAKKRVRPSYTQIHQPDLSNQPLAPLPKSRIVLTHHAARYLRPREEKGRRDDKGHRRVEESWSLSWLLCLVGV